jgi:hypothetical protein
VRGGNVVDVTVEACKDRKKLSGMARAIVKEAQRRGYLRRRPRWTPVPVDEFFASSKKMAKIIISGWGTDDGGCVQICWGSGPILDCVYCCSSTATFECGFVQVVIEDPSPG